MLNTEQAAQELVALCEQINELRPAPAMTLETHELLVQAADKRLARAKAKAMRAQDELEAAERWHSAQVAARLDFIASNPDPQLVML